MFDFKNILSLLFWIILVFIFAFFGGRFTTESVKSDWFKNLNKPGWYPPNWLFGVVWSILYFLMAVSAYRVYKVSSKKSSNTFGNLSLLFFIVQLILNLGWSYLFFKMRNIKAAFFEIIVLQMFIVLTTLSFYTRDKIAAYLMIPYILWVGFATVLNFSILSLN